MSNLEFASVERFILSEASELLDVAEVQADDSFLALHGDSLKAILLTAAIEDRFGVVVDVADVFAATSFRSLSERVAAGG